MARVCDRRSEWGGGVAGSGPRSEEDRDFTVSGRKFIRARLERRDPISRRARFGMPRGARDAPWQPSLRTGARWKVEAVWRVVPRRTRRAARELSGRQTTALEDWDCANCDCSSCLIHLTFQVRLRTGVQSQTFRAQLLKSLELLERSRITSGGWAPRDTRPDRPEVWALADQRREREGRRTPHRSTE